jgi:hypothetical protein
LGRIIDLSWVDSKTGRVGNPGAVEPSIAGGRAGSEGVALFSKLNPLLERNGKCEEILPKTFIPKPQVVVPKFVTPASFLLPPTITNNAPPLSPVQTVFNGVPDAQMNESEYAML